MAKSPTRNAPKLPSYLYKKRGVFYYRFRISKFFSKKIGAGEIRVSLRTGFKREAIAMAKKIHPTVSLRLQTASSLEASQANLLPELRQQVRQLVDDLLAEPYKSPISERDIRLRLNGFLKHEMDSDAQNDTIPPEISAIHPEGSIEHFQQDEMLDRYAREIAHGANTLENSAEWHDLNLLELIQREVFDRAEITSHNALSIARSYERMKATFFRIKAARSRGDFAYETPFYASEAIEYPRKKHLDICLTAKLPDPSSQENDLLLSELISRYCTTQLADKVWEEHTLTDHRGRLENILDILHDKPAKMVSRDDMRKVREILMKLPPSRKKLKRFQGKSIEELLKIPHKKTLSPTTVNIIIDAISSMFSWAIREQLLTSNPAIGLKVKEEKLDIEKKEPFTKEDIEKIFFFGDYKETAFTNPAYFWVPLIGLYSGMRLEEICQLRCKDVYQVEGIWIFDINPATDTDAESKKLKTKNAIRQVPVHPNLIEAGLLNYLEKIKKSKQIRLFPELKITEKSPKYGKQVGKNFSALVKRKGIVGKKSFHSLRHSFAQFFKERGLHNTTFRQIFGHQQTELASRTYGTTLPIKKCYEEIISILDYSQLGVYNTTQKS